MAAKLKLGRPIITARAGDLLVPEDVFLALRRHRRCDWGFASGGVGGKPAGSNRGSTAALSLRGPKRNKILDYHSS